MLSIVIPTHNRADLLRSCLASVARHAPAGTQIIVVDDGSPAATASTVVREFTQVEVIRLPRRQGFCAAANAGIQAAHGEIIEMLNDDTEVQASWAAAAIAHFDDPRVGAVAPLVLTGPDGRIVDSAGDRYYVGGIAGKRGHGERLGPKHLRAQAVFGASASSAFYRRSALQHVGVFPACFGAYFEDVDLAFRLQRAGYRTMFEPAARVFHRVSASYSRFGRRMLEQQSLNEERVFWRNIPGKELVRALPLHLAVLAGKAWRRWQERKLLPFLFGRLRLMLELRAVLRHRRELAGIGPEAPLMTWHIDRALSDQGFANCLSKVRRQNSVANGSSSR